MLIKPRKYLACCSLGILTACLLSTACYSHPDQWVLPFFGSNFDLTADGFKQLMSKLPTMSADEKCRQLRNFAEHAKNAATAEKASYVLARLLQASSAPADIKEAISRFQQAQHLPELAKLCLWHAYECSMKLSDEKAVRDALQSIISNDKGRQIEAQYALAQSWLRTGDRQQARRDFLSVVKNAPSSQFALGSTYYLAQLDLCDADAQLAAQHATPASAVSSNTTQVSDSGSGNASHQNADSPGAAIARALAAWRHYLRMSPDGHFATTIVEQMLARKDAVFSADDHNVFAQVYYLAGNYAAALDEWKKAGNTREWFKQSLALIRLGRSTEGKTLLLKSLKSHPADQAVPAAATMVCHMLNHNEAVALWTDILHRSPKFADAAMYNLALRASTPAAAVAYYRRILAQHPTSAYAPESSWWIGWEAAKAGKSKDALAVWKNAAARYPDSRAATRMLYWQGKLAERLGQKSAAKLAYQAAASKAPWLYYAHRAQARLIALAGGKDPGWTTDPRRHVSWSPGADGDWKFPEMPPYLVPQAGTTLAILTDLHQWDECLSATPDKNDALKAFFLAKLHMPHEAINAAGKALHGQPRSNELWELAYPLLYARTISTESASKNVDPYLVQALVREESRYNNEAISRSHALGLMQLLPATAYGVAHRLGVPIKSDADFYDPDKNLRLGIDYLSYTLKRFKGNALFAVASYNGGPNAVQHWSATGPTDADAFVENIPFTETRDYVRKVFGSYWNYECVYSKTIKGRAKTSAFDMQPSRVRMAQAGR